MDGFTQPENFDFSPESVIKYRQENGGMNSITVRIPTLVESDNGKELMLIPKKFSPCMSACESKCPYQGGVEFLLEEGETTPRMHYSCNMHKH